MSNNTVEMTVKVPEKFDKALEKRKKNTGISKAAQIRSALDKHIQEVIK